MGIATTAGDTIAAAEATLKQPMALLLALP